MEFSSYISTRWDQLFGYTVGTGLALQSLKSVYIGSKEVFAAFNGSEAYGHRIQRAASDNLSVLSNVKNLVVGRDAFSKRFSHLSNGLKNLSISAVTGLFSYLLFFKAFENSPKEQFALVPTSTALDEAHNENLREGSSTNFVFKNHRCSISNSLDPITNALLSACEEEGFISNDYFLPDNPSSLKTSELKYIMRCIRERSLNQRFRSLLKTPQIREQLTQIQDSVQNMGSEIAANAHSTDLTTAPSDTTLTTRSSDKTNHQLRDVLDNYLKDFLSKYANIVDGYSKYLEGHKARFDYFKKINMTQSMGPFEIHIDKACDNNLFDQLPFFNNLDEQHCTKYKAFKKALQLAHRQREKIDKLDPAFSETNCELDVFSKIWERADQAELMLPPNLYEAFITIKELLKERYSQDAAS